MVRFVGLDGYGRSDAEVEVHDHGGIDDRYFHHGLERRHPARPPFHLLHGVCEMPMRSKRDEPVQMRKVVLVRVRQDALQCRLHPVCRWQEEEPFPEFGPGGAFIHGSMPVLSSRYCWTPSSVTRSTRRISGWSYSLDRTGTREEAKTRQGCRHLSSRQEHGSGLEARTTAILIAQL